MMLGVWRISPGIITLVAGAPPYLEREIGYNTDEKYAK